ncbi:MAG: alpha/beta hydrolase, partial [Cyanobacteria bacterium J06600_6]
MTYLNIFPRRSIWSYLTVGVLQLSCCLALETYLHQKAIAADNVILNYGVLEFSVSVDALETYATTGEIEGELKSYA